MIRAFIFDLDGTIANTEKLHFRAWRQTLMQNGVDNFTFESFLAFVGTSNEKVAEDYISSHELVKSVEELVLEKQGIYMELIPGVELCPGVRQLLASFYGEMEMAVASSSHKKEVCAILDAHRLSRYFSFVVGGDMVKRKKPDPEIYLKTKEMMAIPAENCLAFEDSSHGLNAAKNAGMYGVAVPNEFTSGHDFSRADKVVASLNEINRELIREIALSFGPAV